MLYAPRCFFSGQRIGLVISTCSMMYHGFQEKMDKRFSQVCQFLDYGDKIVRQIGCHHNRTIREP